MKTLKTLSWSKFLRHTQTPAQTQRPTVTCRLYKLKVLVLASLALRLLFIRLINLQHYASVVWSWYYATKT